MTNLATHGSIAIQTDDGIKLSSSDFNYFKETIFQKAGISLSPAKMSLVEARLRHRIKDLNLSDFEDYRSFLEKIPQSHGEWQNFVNSLTTNKTSFFREKNHYEYLKNEFLPRWLKSGKDTLRVWCAASSTGEEAYSIGMVLNELLPKNKSFKILATDIDTNVLTKASNGVYPKIQLKDVPEEFQSSFDFGTGSIENWVRIKKQIKEKILFKQHNLMEQSSPEKGTFDLVFCCNVLIYFKPEQIEFIANKLHYAANVGSVLFIGNSESLLNVNTAWKTIRPSIYSKKGNE